MKVILLTVAAALSLGVGLADANENEGGAGMAAAPKCILTTADQCNQMTPPLPRTAVSVLDPKAPSTSAAQAKSFFLLY
jgi:hypothetical protein